jgi:hypothetical protein
LGTRNPFRRLFRRKPFGFPLGRRVSADPADHAEDFAHRYADPPDWQACLRMEELGIPRDRIGSNDRLHGLEGRAFNPFEHDGGGISTGGRINIDSGLCSIRIRSPSDTARRPESSGRNRGCVTGRML